MEEYPAARRGYLACDIPRPQRLADRITAIPWCELPQLFEEE